MIYAALLPLGEAPLLASVRIGKWKPKCKSFSGYLEMGPTFKIENGEFHQVSSIKNYFMAEDLGE